MAVAAIGLFILFFFRSGLLHEIVSPFHLVAPNPFFALLLLLISLACSFHFLRLGLLWLTSSPFSTSSSALTWHGLFSLDKISASFSRSFSFPSLVIKFPFCSAVSASITSTASSLSCLLEFPASYIKCSPSTLPFCLWTIGSKGSPDLRGLDSDPYSVSESL